MPKIEIREATIDDVEAMRGLVNDEIRNDVNVWDETPRTSAQMRAWLSERLDSGMAVLVATRAGGVIGYAGYGPFRPHSGYIHTVEHSVYVDREERGSGAGRALLRALVKIAEERGVHAMIGGIEAGNAASIHIHNEMGFVETGRMPEVGKKFDRWLTLVLMQRTFDEDITANRE